MLPKCSRGRDLASLATPSGRWLTLPLATAWARGCVDMGRWGLSVDELRQRWLSLTRHDIPARAEAEQWTLRADHCFQRVIVDAVCEGRWYDHVAGRPAYRHLDEHRLALAVSLAQQLATATNGPPALRVARRPVAVLAWQVAEASAQAGSWCAGTGPHGTKMIWTAQRPSRGHGAGLM